MTAMLDVPAYLERMDYAGPTTPTLDTLRALHQAHLLAVPFENLDILRGKPIRLDDATLFDKIVRRRRGGFCYELNGLFAALLRRLGFPVTLLSARVAREDGGFGPEFDHLVLLLSLPDPWLVDVGFGRSFRDPMPLTETAESASEGETYGFVREGSDWMLRSRAMSTEAWTPQFRFTLQPRTLDDFAAMNHFQQTSPESHFTHGPLCTIATDDGRVTLHDQRLIITRGSAREEREVADDTEWRQVLRAYFNIDLDLDTNHVMPSGRERRHDGV